MNANQETTSFEDRLLAELRQVVAANPRPTTVASGRPALARRWRRPLMVAGGLAAAAVASATVIGFGEDGGATAWAVTPNDDGTVTVVIYSLSDADGLERQLRDAGVPADVKYLPPGKKCADPAPGAPHPGEFGWTTARGGEGEGLPTGGVAGEAPWGAMETGTDDDGSIAFTINPVPEGQNLAITTQARQHEADGLVLEESAVRVEYFQGDQSPCVVVDA
jgi:hypothetical protein